MSLYPFRMTVGDVGTGLRPNTALMAEYGLHALRSHFGHTLLLVLLQLLVDKQKKRTRNELFSSTNMAVITEFCKSIGLRFIPFVAELRSNDESRIW